MGALLGHRMLIPRLLMLADEGYFHFTNTPLVVVTMIAQLGLAALLMWVEWRLLRSAPRWLALFVVTATAHLALSSLQLESFAYGIEVLYAVGLLGAIGSVVLFALWIRNGTASRNYALASLVWALICAFSWGTGVFIGPVLLLVAFGLGASRRTIIGLAIASGLFAAAYSAGWENPGEGIGFRGALTHPFGTIWTTAQVLGGLITNQSRLWGAVCGMLGLALLSYALTRLVRGRLAREEAALVGISVFLALNALSVALTRYTFEEIAGLGARTMLPSRYLTVPLLFWAVSFSLVTAERGSAFSKVQIVLVAGLVGYLTLHTIPSQLDVSVAWLKFHRELDVAGAGLIMGATDPEFLSKITPVEKDLDYHRPYMRQHQFSFFAEDRASWIGKDLNKVFGSPGTKCRGAIDSRIAGPTLARLDGFVDGPGVKFPFKRDIVFTNAVGKIDGLGNTIVPSEKRGGQKFVAYADSGATAAYLITSVREACRFAQLTPQPKQ